MSDASHSLGGRTELVDPSSLTPAQKSLYDLMMERWIPWGEKVGFQARLDDGRLLGPFNLLLLSPEIAAAFLELQRVEQTLTSLSKRVREVVILSVGAVFRSDYERYAHAAVGRAAGLSADAVQALREGREAPGLSAEENLAQRFALALSRRRGVDAALFDEAEAAIGERGIVDIIMLAGCYDLVASLLNVFETPVPE